MAVVPTHIASRGNPRVKQLRAAFTGNARLSEGLIAIEGENLLFEAMRSGLVFKTIFLSDRRPTPHWNPEAVELVELTEDVFSSVVDTRSPQGIAALVEPPAWTLADAFSETAAAPLVVVAAGLQDPGNLGTLVRSAEAFGASAILTTPGTVSEWNQKALRASAGSVFRVPVVEVTLDEIAALKLRGLHLYAAVADDPLSPTATPLEEADFTQPCALLIGNEGSGLATEFLEICDARITIPMPGRVESLNAAVSGSLLLYEAARQRTVLLATHNSQLTADL
jgi:TrmH family RNA methyltransferase